MRQLLIILVSFISLIGNAQYVAQDSTIDASTISGTDTTIFIEFRKERGTGLTVDFTELNANDGILDFGFSNDKVNFCSIDLSDNPYTLDKTVYTKSVNGVSKSRIGFYADKWSYKYIAVKFTKSSCTSGKLYIKFCRYLRKVSYMEEYMDFLPVVLIFLQSCVCRH